LAELKAIAWNSRRAAGFPRLSIGVRERVCRIFAVRRSVYDRIWTYLIDIIGVPYRIRTGVAAVREGLATQKDSGQCQYGAELHRFEGIALSGLNRIDEAENAFAAALRVARLQQAKAYELRAAVSLARFWCEQGQRAQALELLAPVYGWFTEGFDTTDLGEAKTLLDQLA
jgi:hypothetical protein